MSDHFTVTKENGRFVFTKTDAILEQKEISRPEYVRLPPPGAKCKLTGLSRSTLAELAVPCDANGHKPPVKSLVIKKRGATRGIRLINYDSLIDHLHNLEGAEVVTS